MGLPETGLIHPARDKREPVVDPCKASEGDCAHHDVVEVTDHVVGVMQHEVDRNRREEDPSDAADDEV